MLSPVRAVLLVSADGLDATAQIRAQEQKHHRGPVPIIAVTADLSDDHLVRYREVGVDDVLGKPFKLEQLVKMLSKVARVLKFSPRFMAARSESHGGD